MRHKAIIEATLLLGVLYCGTLSAARGGDSQALIPANATWSYFDRGVPHADWAQPSTAVTWPSGPAKLGYGEGDENTEISPGPGASPYPSAFFRRWFNVPADISFYNQLVLGVLRDDGAVVYLNGVEIYRSNMPSNTITPGTYAVTNVAGGAERFYFSKTLDPTILQPGTTNLLAVEVHQSGPSSDDLSFALRLTLTNAGSEIVRGPYLQSGSPTGVIVCWRTSTPTDSLVRWGLATNALTHTNVSTEPKTNHAVAITGLTPDTRYHYSFGNTDGTLNTNNSEFYFVTVPTNTRPFRIWAIGDAGTANSNQRAVRDAYEAFPGNERTDVWLMLGDNAYPTGTDAQYQQAVFRMYTKHLPNTLLYPAVGNHETYHNPNNLDEIDYLRIFSLPANAEAGGVASGTELYYSFDYANVHFICLDSMINDRSSNGFMYAWLEQDLNATTKDWIIAYWHHPPYTKGSHDSDDSEHDPELGQMRRNFLPLLEANGVDLVLCGHSHCYERSFLVQGHYGESTSLTAQMILNGNSGRDEENGPYRKTGPQGTVYVVAGSSGQATGGPLDHPVMFTSLDELGSLVIDVDDKRLNARFVRENGSIDDWFTMSKESAQLQIVSVAVSDTGPNGEITITWNSTLGQAYQVWHTEALDVPNPTWLPVALVPAVSGTTSWTGPMLPGESAAFYRISEGP